MRRWSVAVMLCLAVLGCGQITLVEATRQRIGDAYSVDAQRAWNRLPADDAEVWTADGPGLQSLRFYADLVEGERLFTPRGGGADDETFPTYRSDMAITEIMEFVVDSLARSGANGVEGRGLRPAAFGAAPGFRFELSFASASGLRYTGVAIGAVVDGRLHLILYSGTETHYFPKYRDDVERLFASVRLI